MTRTGEGDERPDTVNDESSFSRGCGPARSQPSKSSFAPTRLACSLVARRIVGNDEDARDVIQDAFLSAFRSLDRFHGRRQALDLAASHRRQQRPDEARTRRRKPEESIEPLLPAFSVGWPLRRAILGLERARRRGAVPSGDAGRWFGGTSTSCPRASVPFCCCVTSKD